MVRSLSLSVSVGNEIFDACSVQQRSCYPHLPSWFVRDNDHVPVDQHPPCAHLLTLRLMCCTRFFHQNDCFRGDKCHMVHVAKNTVRYSTVRPVEAVVHILQSPVQWAGGAPPDSNASRT